MHIVDNHFSDVQCFHVLNKHYQQLLGIGTEQFTELLTYQ